MLRVVAHQIQRSILKDICTSMWFFVGADETVDLIEQVHGCYKSNYHCGCNSFALIFFIHSSQYASDMYAHTLLKSLKTVQASTLLTEQMLTL